MKRLLLSLLAVALLTGGAVGQTQTHTWKMGPLSWNDFVHKNALNGRCSYLEYYMGVEPLSQKANGVTYNRVAAYAYMSPEYSWADTLYRTPTLLRYNQAAFGLMEYYRRQMDRRLHAGALFDEHQVLENTMRQLNEDIDRLESETQQGNDTVALVRWEQQVRHNLDSLSVVNTLSHTDAPYRWGLAFGLGFNGVAGEWSQYFTHGIGGGFRFDNAWHRHFLLLGMDMAGSRCLDSLFNTVNMDNDLYTGDHLTVLDFYFAYGYNVVETARMRVMPYVGYGLVGFFFDPGGDASSVGPTSGSLHFGIDIWSNFSNSVDQYGFSIGRFNAEHDIFSVGCRLYGTYGRLTRTIDQPAGFTFGLQLTLGMLSCAATM